MIKVISYKICPFVQRVTALLEAKKIAYDIEFIDLSNMPQWFLDISPNAQVPLLVTEAGIALFESDAIVEYLDEVQATIESDVTAEQRAIDRAWSYQASKHYLVQCGAMSSADESTLAERTETLGKAFARAEKQLGDGPFFKGESFSNVDIAWLPLLHRAAIIEQRTGYDFVADFPKVKAWQSSMMETGLAEKSVSEDFEDAFAGFYLSDKTFLGSGKNCSNPDGGCGTSSSCCG
jgi:glutathione S-transferase